MVRWDRVRGACMAWWLYMDWPWSSVGTCSMCMCICILRDGWSTLLASMSMGLHVRD